MWGSWDNLSSHLSSFCVVGGFFKFIFILKKKKNQISVILSHRLKLFLFLCGIREELCLHYSPPKRNSHLCFHCKQNVNIYLCKANCDLSTESVKEESYQIPLIYVHVLSHTHTSPAIVVFLNEQFRWCTRGKSSLIKEKKFYQLELVFLQGPYHKIQK